MINKRLINRKIYLAEALAKAGAFLFVVCRRETKVNLCNFLQPYKRPMIKKLVEILKRIRPLKNTAKFFLQFFKRKPVFFFHTPNAAFAKATRKPEHNNNGQLKMEIYGVNEIMLYKNAISYPLTHGKKKTHSGGLLNSETYSLIPEAIHYNGDFCQEQPMENIREISRSDIPQIEHVVLYGGILYNNFGHFLLESIGRLWAYEYVKQLDPYILFYTYWGDPKYLERKNFVHQVLAGFNIPHKRVLFINKPAKIKRILIPAQKYGYGYCKKPDGIFLKFISSFRFPSAIPRGFENGSAIYVSRSKIPFGLGKIIGEKIFETWLSSNGYKIFYPEQYSLYEQLTVYNHAKKIIFCDGSAVHTCILLPKLEAAVAIIARRKDTRWIPEEITDQFSGYGKTVTWIDAVKDQYQFGLESWYALSFVDWYKVSCSLKKSGFVENLFEDFSNADHRQLVRTELDKHIRAIKNNPKFVNHMPELKEELKDAT